jgi:hypothetical protein
MKNISAIEVTPWDGDDRDFCVVKIYCTQIEKSVDFTFNMEYLFEWVNDEHREMFLEEICTKMLKREMTDTEFEWNVEFKRIIEQMRSIWIKK